MIITQNYYFFNLSKNWYFLKLTKNKKLQIYVISKKIRENKVKLIWDVCVPIQVQIQKLMVFN